MTAYRGEDMDNGYGTTEHALKSAHDALWAIANMQITENTDKGEVLALCMSIARVELEKCFRYVSFNSDPEVNSKGENHGSKKLDCEDKGH